MKILITGGAGFIGSHVSDALIARGDSVIALDNLSTGRRENIGHLLGSGVFEFVEGSILDSVLVNQLVARCDMVYHFAAAVGVELVVDHPLESLKTNIQGTEIVLDACLKYGKKILLASTSEIYGKNTSDHLSEEDDRILGSALKSRWGYSTAKAIDELMGYLYWKQKGLPVVIVRFFNTVGPRQTGAYGMVVPRFVRQALQGEDITVYGNGTQRRCFLLVADAVRAIVTLMDTPQACGNVYNVGNTQEITMDELAAMIVRQTGSSSNIVHIPYNQAYSEGFEDMQRRFPSIQKIHTLTGWEPTASISQIIQSVVHYHQSTSTTVSP